MDDEDLWLEALEKGELDDNGEIPKVRDPSLLTARQRALLDRTTSILVEEISPISKEETEEERKKRLEKNRQRKIQVSMFLFFVNKLKLIYVLSIFCL